jgi:transcriptional regulator with XRE-family HTH domain
MNIQIGERIKQLRQEKNLTQQQMADTLGIDRSNYSKYELGKLEINNEMLVQLAKYFNVPTDFLLGLVD